MGSLALHPQVLDECRRASDLALHLYCLKYKSIGKFALPDSALMASGKMMALQRLITELQVDGHRCVIFSQWTSTLDGACGAERGAERERPAAR